MLDNVVPKDFKSWAVTVPVKDTIESKLLGSPHRKNLSKDLNKGTELLAKMKASLQQLGVPLTEGDDKAPGEASTLQNLLADCKDCVGVTAVCSVVYVTGPQAATAEELQGLVEDVEGGLKAENIVRDICLMDRLKTIWPKTLAAAA